MNSVYQPWLGESCHALLLFPAHSYIGRLVFAIMSFVACALGNGVGLSHTRLNDRISIESRTFKTRLPYVAKQWTLDVSRVS